jgi:hypothetical protein
MKLLFSLYFILALTTGAASPVAVETATGDWSKLRRLQTLGSDHLHTKVMVRLHQIASQAECSLPGYSAGKLDLRISFAAQYDRAGSLQRIVLPKLNCPEAEGLIGGALLDMMRGGDYRPTGKNPRGWYRGQFGFSITG